MQENTAACKKNLRLFFNQSVSTQGKNHKEMIFVGFFEKNPTNSLKTFSFLQRCLEAIAQTDFQRVQERRLQ